MEQLFTNNVGAVAAIGALAVLILAATKLVSAIKARNGNGLENIVKRVLSEVDGNHLHEIPEVIRALERIEEKLDRQFERLHEKLDYIKKT